MICIRDYGSQGVVISCLTLTRLRVSDVARAYLFPAPPTIQQNILCNLLHKIASSLFIIYHYIGMDRKVIEVVWVCRSESCKSWSGSWMPIEGLILWLWKFLSSSPILLPLRSLCHLSAPFFGFNAQRQL